MALAIGQLNGKVLQPGEILSANDTIGERTIAAGYRDAPIFRDGEVVDDTGGGICQVGSTLYNVALLANLEVLERDHHSRPVWYCPTGRDAALYWGQKNVRIKNSLTHPLMFLGEVRGDRLWAAIVGHASDKYEVELTVTGLSRIGAGRREIPDPTLPAGKTVVEKSGVAGARATLWCKISRGGKLIKKEKLHDDYYSPVSAVVHVGTKPKPPPPGTVPPVPPGTVTPLKPGGPGLKPGTGGAQPPVTTPQPPVAPPAHH